MEKNIIETLQELKKLVIQYETAVDNFEQSKILLKNAKEYQPTRLKNFDEEYLPKFIEESIGEKPKDFGKVDPRKYFKKTTQKKEKVIEEYNQKLKFAKEEFYKKYSEKRELFNKYDCQEKEEKIYIAQEKFDSTKNVLEKESQKIDSVGVLPRMLMSSIIIDKLISYFDNWRTDNLKDAINLYFDEKWKIDESNRIRDLLENIEQKLDKNNEQFSYIITNIEEIGETISDVNTTLNNLNNTITEETN